MVAKLSYMMISNTYGCKVILYKKQSVFLAHPVQKHKIS